MASGKYLKQQPKKTIKSYQKKNSPPRYTMPKEVKRQIFALAAAGFFTIAGLSYLVQDAKTQSIPSDPLTHATSAQNGIQDVDTLEFVEAETEKLYTIGIANYDAEITVNDKTYPIGNSFVIASEGEVVVSDVHGNFLKGSLSADEYREVTKINEKQLFEFNYFKVVSDSPANVRSYGEISEDNVISTVNPGDYVLSYRPSTPEYDGEWLPTLSIFDGKLYAGYMREDIIKEVGAVEAVNYRTEQNMENIQNNLMVDTSKDDYIPLKLRSEPGQDVITEIPYGSFVQLLGETKQYANKSWNLVNYKTPDGNQYKGWVASKYLTNEVVQDQPGPKVVNGIQLNATGNVTGIDVSTLSPNALREILQKGISDQTRSVHGTFDTSELAGDVGYVYIKLGASTYGTGDFKTLDYNNYIEQVAICEELGIPYGFYYYSTAVTVEEANIELNCIQDRIEDLRQRYDMKNNLLEIAVDIELADSSDRQYRGNIIEQTEAKAALINGIQELNLSDNVLIYGPGRVMQPDLDQIFDLDYLSKLLDKPEAVNIWQCSLMDKNGNMKSDFAKYIDYAERHGFSTTMCQSGLDLYVESNGKIVGLIDINNMDFEYYQKLVNLQRKKENITYTLEFNNESNQNQGKTFSLKANTQNDDDLEL